MARRPLNEASPLLHNMSFRSEGGASAYSTSSEPSIVPQRWRRRFPIIQSTINGASMISNSSHYFTEYVVVKSRPLRVSVFAGLAFVFGVVVLVQTQMLVATKNIPDSAFRAVDDLPGDSAPKFLADASNCTELYFEQVVDHFSWLPAETRDENGSVTPSAKPATYKQRYLINDQFWDPSDKKAPMFFYTGNEGDVTLYANHTGLMWENAQKFNALVVFAEHRYYGKSMPFGDDYMKHLAYLNHEQALADFTELIFFLQKGEHKAEGHPVIVFGGSYGGMLSAWFRMKYPSIVHGAIAASAPIFGFPSFPQWKGDNYWQIVTRDATPETGSAKNCVPNAKKSWQKIFALAKSEAGREKLTNIFRLCTPLTKESEGEDLAMLTLFGFDNLAMGNFPYPSSYLTGGAVDLPAWPVREACSHLAGDFEDVRDDDALLEALRDAGNVFNNATKDVQCLKLPSQEDFDGIWDFQWCTQMLPQETYFNTNGETDMFWSRNITMEQIQDHCQKTWGVTPDPNWIRVSYGDSNLRFASNIVFSNGMLDPWSSGGVHQVPEGSKVTIVNIEEGAHHLDLFFSHPDDPVSVKKARKIEVAHIRKWIDEYVTV
uniref:Lysosomal Pro-X carboxypeptidase n=1 Tax=Globisporangium ultimum (strain ATCC 200006 / CBS 805.95 / DAOM BR144) TaxID=431595 RepID=K3X632_GLOUD